MSRGGVVAAFAYPAIVVPTNAIVAQLCRLPTTSFPEDQPNCASRLPLGSARRALRAGIRSGEQPLQPFRDGFPGALSKEVARDVHQEAAPLEAPPVPVIRADIVQEFTRAFPMKGPENLSFVFDLEIGFLGPFEAVLPPATAGGAGDST